MIKGVKKEKEICILVFISCFTVSVIPSINTFKFSSYFMVLIISFIPSFEVNKPNPFPPLTPSFPLISLPSLLSYPTFCLYYLNFLLRRNLPDWTILDNCALQSFISVDIFLAIAFLVLVVCFVVRNMRQFFIFKVFLSCY